MVRNEAFYKFQWDFPKKETNVFKGAVKEYPLKNGTKIALAFTATGVYFLKDEMGYYDRVDYTAKDGIFNKTVAITRYDGCQTVGRVFVSETGDSIDEVVICEDVFTAIPFTDAVTARQDIIERLKAVGQFGFFTITSLKPE